MRHFLLFLGGLIALFVLLANLGPMVFLALGIWLLYVIFKKFTKSQSTSGKVGWVILGLLVLSITAANLYALVGIAAAYALYLIVKHWRKDDIQPKTPTPDEDPFTNFEHQWAELNQ
ncbi:flagellar basal body rod protein [Lentibacillus saliphilus]|uniref:lmo0954 family membrane protein n=1 Tax=Lentibacillus saliphilus TaxID=2737028 RepID=UPI001C2F9ECD|nr:flagellar basal body rod protein [Lentibacillus saliphilus]